MNTLPSQKITGSGKYGEITFADLAAEMSDLRYDDKAAVSWNTRICFDITDENNVKHEGLLFDRIYFDEDDHTIVIEASA